MRAHRASFECGHETFGRFTQSPCPSDPKFPALDDYELQFHEFRGATYVQWICSVFPKTKMARQLHIMDGVGSTREEAEQRLRDNYARRSKKWGTQQAWPAADDRGAEGVSARSSKRADT